MPGRQNPSAMNAIHSEIQARGAMPPAGLAGPVDHEVLNRLLCDDQSAVREVLGQYLTSCPDDATGVVAAAAAADWQAALRFAHRLKGACRMVGANLLADVCEHVERAVKGQDPRQVAGAVEELRRESDRVQDYLRAWLQAA